jgi:hypothetical protein
MWDKGPLIRILFCISVFGIFLYCYIDKQNAVTRRRLEIPVIAKGIADIKEFNTRLKYQIDLFENPEHLMQLAGYSQYSHLKQPMLKEILTLQEGLALEVSSEDREEKMDVRPKLKFAIGAKQ